MSGDFGDAATYERVARAVGDAKCPVFYLEIPPFLFGRVIKGLTEAGLTKDRASRRREAVRPRSRVGPRARGGDPPVHRRVPAVPDRPLPGQDGSRRVPVHPLRELEHRADLEPQPHRRRRDHDGGELRGRGPGHFYDPGRRAPRRGRQPPDAAAGRRRDGGPGRRRRGARSRTRGSRCSARCRRPTRSTTSAGSTTASSTSTGSRPGRPPRRMRRCSSRSTTGAGPAFPGSSVRGSDSR